MCSEEPVDVRCLGFQPSLLVCQNILINVSSIAMGLHLHVQENIPINECESVQTPKLYASIIALNVSSHIMLIFYFSGMSLR